MIWRLPIVALPLVTRRGPKDRIVYLEVERLDFDRWALTLKGGTPGEIRSLALDVWQDSLLDITDRFRLDVSRDITRRKRAEFKALLDRMTQDLLQED